MSWNDYPPENYYDHPNRPYYDATNDIIDCLRQELALNDYLLATEIESAALSEFDRNLLATELYKERLMALATSSRSQRLVVQMGAAMVRCVQGNQINRRGKRPNYNQHAVPYQPNQYRQQYWAGPSYNNNNLYNSGIQRPIRKNRKRKRTAARINPIPVQVSPGQVNSGTTTVETSTVSILSTSTQVNTSTALVKTASAQVSPIGTAKVTATPATATVTPAKPTATSAKTTTAYITPAQIKTTGTINKTTPQTVASTCPKTSSALVKTTATVKTITPPATTSTPIKTVPATVKTSSIPIVCTPAPFSIATAPVNSTAILKRKVTSDSIFAEDIDVPIPPKKSKIPVKTTAPSKASSAVTKTALVSGKSMLPVKKENENAHGASQNVPTLFSINMSHIQLQFSHGINAIDNSPSEPTVSLGSETVKKEPCMDDDFMYDDLEDHL